MEKIKKDSKDFNEEELKIESEDLLELRYLTKENAAFQRTEGGFVSLDYKEKHYDRVAFYRTFPVTEPEEFISVREVDEKAREIGMIQRLSDLKTDQAEMIKEQLRLRYFTPQIEKILDIKQEHGYAYFDVHTNFGSCRFTIRTGGDSVISLSDKRVMITDLDGNKYEIPDIYTLTANERKKLDLFI